MAAPRRIDLTGQRFGLLTVTGHSHTYLKKAFWLCRCDCGRETIGRGRDLGNGRKKTCGSRECRLILRPKTTRKKWKPKPERRSWENMIKRCEDEKQHNYQSYGGRGIKVCQRWRESFEAFLDDMGPRPDGFSIERKDVNGHYEPDNCLWIPHKDQYRNLQRSVYVTLGSERMLLIDLCKKYDLNKSVIYGRLRNGWLIEEAICIPVRERKDKS